LKLKREARRLAVMSASAAVMAFNLKSFVRSGGLNTGGATGLALLLMEAVRRFTGWEPPFTAVTLLVNAIPIYIGFRFLGRKFTATSCAVILLTGVLADLIPPIPITRDLLLCAVFGGILDGAAISACLTEGTTTGGTDFISIYLSEKRGVDSWNLIFCYNAVVLLLAGRLNGWDVILYSIIYQFVTTQLLHTLYKRYQKNTLLIVTEKPEKICQMISEKTSHGATVLRGRGSYEGGEKFLVYSVVSRGESRRILRQIRLIDPAAFINLLRTEEVGGDFYLPPND